MTAYDPTPYRAEAPIVSERVYLDHAALAPLPLRSQEAARAVLAEQAGRGAPVFPEWLERVEETRARAARLLNAEAGEVVMVTNTAAGLSLVADALPWNPGDAVLVSTPDFPSLVYPFAALVRRGVRCVSIPRGPGGRLGVADVERALRSEPRTRLVAISSVDYSSGFLADLEAIGALCRERGLRFAVDAIQSLGAVPHDVRAIACDFLCAGGHKWLLAPAGAGLLFVSRVTWSVLSQPNGGWKSVVDPFDFSLHFERLRPDATRLEPGTPNFAGIAALGASLDLLLEADPARVHAHLLDLTSRLADGLRERGHEVVSPWGDGERSGILTTTATGDPDALAARLAERWVSCSVRQGRLRLSPHLWNSVEDVARFFSAFDGD